MLKSRFGPSKTMICLLLFYREVPHIMLSRLVASSGVQNEAVCPERIESMRLLPSLPPCLSCQEGQSASLLVDGEMAEVARQGRRRENADGTRPWGCAAAASLRRPWCLNEDGIAM